MISEVTPHFLINHPAEVSLELHKLSTHSKKAKVAGLSIKPILVTLLLKCNDVTWGLYGGLHPFDED